MTSATTTVGFAATTLESQSVFRVLLDALAQPGKIGRIPEPPAGIPVPLDPATATVALCLFDHDTQIWLGDGIGCMDVYDYLKLHCSCPLIKSSSSADFAILSATDGVLGLGQFDPGTDAYPDRSTTLIVQVPDIDTGASIRLTGPGIETEASLHVTGMSNYFWQERRDQQSVFPCGIDLIFTCGDRLVALPRSTEIEV
jgi:alpha-D-ribose 1-methylphosphonate 5-triphosphate synthase subunit PhnH